jgi:hypothetical protein
MLHALLIHTRVHVSFERHNTIAPPLQEERTQLLTHGPFSFLVLPYSSWSFYAEDGLCILKSGAVTSNPNPLASSGMIRGGTHQPLLCTQLSVLTCAADLAPQSRNSSAHASLHWHSWHRLRDCLALCSSHQHGAPGHRTACKRHHAGP